MCDEHGLENAVMRPSPPSASSNLVEREWQGIGRGVIYFALSASRPISPLSNARKISYSIRSCC